MRRVDQNRVTISGIRAALEVLERHEEGLRKALSYANDAYSFEEIVEKVLRAELLLYVLPNSVMICSISHYSDVKHFNCFLCSGDIAELMTQGHDLIMERAAEMGCDRVSLTGRMGWKKVLTKLGWENPVVTMSKPVANP